MEVIMKQFIIALTVFIGLQTSSVTHGMKGFDAPGQSYSETVKANGSRKIEVDGVPADTINAVKDALTKKLTPIENASSLQLLTALTKKSVCNTTNYFLSFVPTTIVGLAKTVSIPAVIMAAAGGMLYYQTGEIPTIDHIIDFLRTNMVDVIKFAQNYAWTKGRSIFITAEEARVLQQLSNSPLDSSILATQALDAQQCFNTTMDVLGNNVIECVAQALNVTTTTNTTLARTFVQGGIDLSNTILESGAGYTELGSTLYNSTITGLYSLSNFTGNFFQWATRN